jgi:dUTP pyrophosphatase
MKYAIYRDTTKPTGRRGEDAGIDVYVPNDFPETKLYIGQQVNIPTGIKAVVPNGYMLKAENKSGIAVKRGLVCGATVVDVCYRGEIHANLFKVVEGKEDLEDDGGKYTIIKPGDKIVQFVLEKISDEELEEITTEEYDNLPATVRGAGAFGSTGIK